MPYEPHARGCGCERCAKRREYARNRYHAKKNGENYTKEREPRSRTSDLRLPQPTGSTGRFVWTEGPNESVVHWMPKEEEWWVCPTCGAEFLKKEGTWRMERYT